METLELDDIQGIIVRGYGALPSAAFLLLEVENPRTARQWLGKLVDKVLTGQTRPSEACFNLAFTHKGLQALGLHNDALNSFSLEFQDGMCASEHRRRILGDVGGSAPEYWDWGAPGQRPVHVALLLYALDEDQLVEFTQAYLNRLTRSGVALVRKLDTLLHKGRKEHFGFRDGIAQPVIAGYKDGAPANTIMPGEFLFGYLDEYGVYPPTPTIDTSKDPQGLLRQHPSSSGLRDFGRNGSYLVFRQLHQDVHGFWKFLNDKTRSMDGSEQPEARIRLAAKMVGRWPSGAPLVLSPDRDDPDRQDEDLFSYHETDEYGDKCPIGSHIRRSNPRDSLGTEPGTESAIKIGKRHRIIRRGRAYGNPVAASMDPKDILKAGADDGDRGLHFLCFNTNLNRQFEFIQHTWVNNPKFGGLHQDADPLIGVHDPDGKGVTGVFTVQGLPVRKRITGLRRFVEMRGGAYFFMPGKSALRYLASIP